MTIRNAEPGDAAALAELMTQLGYPTAADAMAARLASILANPQFATFVATTKAAVCGMIGLCWSDSYEHDDRSGRIVALVVADQARRQGIGRALIDAAERHFATIGVSRISLTTRLEREAAQRFYSAAGYARTGIRFAKILKGETA